MRGVQPAARSILHMMSRVVPQWANTTAPGVLFRYIGVDSGLAIVFPGVTYRDSYDARHQ